MQVRMQAASAGVGGMESGQTRIFSGLERLINSSDKISENLEMPFARGRWVGGQWEDSSTSSVSARASHSFYGKEVSVNAFANHLKDSKAPQAMLALLL
jgi:hypothetical protein